MNDLTDLQISDLGARLSQRSRVLKTEIREALIQSDQQHHKDLAGSVADTGDEAVADMLVDVEIALVDRHVKELRDIESALQQIRDGSYGACIDCGNAIGYERLTANPSATRCIRCQERQEIVYSRGTTHTL
jgi:RNA polymerase-binding protein DksA